jgi:hypothetical protein
VEISFIRDIDIDIYSYKIRKDIKSFLELLLVKKSDREENSSLGKKNQDMKRCDS